MNKPQIIIAEITKTFKNESISTSEFRSTMVSFDRDKLVEAIQEKYKTVLVKNDNDEFPYFTDGGFKFSFENEDCRFEVVALMYDVI